MKSLHACRISMTWYPFVIFVSFVVLFHLLVLLLFACCNRSTTIAATFLFISSVCSWSYLVFYSYALNRFVEWIIVWSSFFAFFPLIAEMQFDLIFLKVYTGILNRECELTVRRIQILKALDVETEKGVTPCVSLVVSAEVWVFCAVLILFVVIILKVIVKK